MNRSVLHPRIAPRRRFGVLLVSLLGLGAPASAFAQYMPSQTPNEPPFFAIQNARIVTGTGQVIDGGTVVMANGLIEAVGPDVPVPGDARVIDGSGLTVYPGLFDALSQIGLETESSGRRAGRRRRWKSVRAAGPRLGRARRSPRDHALDERGGHARSRGPSDRALARGRLHDRDGGARGGDRHGAGGGHRSRRIDRAPGPGARRSPGHDESGRRLPFLPGVVDGCDVVHQAALS